MRSVRWRPRQQQLLQVQKAGGGGEQHQRTAVFQSSLTSGQQQLAPQAAPQRLFHQSPAAAGLSVLRQRRRQLLSSRVSGGSRSVSLSFRTRSHQQRSAARADGLSIQSNLQHLVFNFNMAAQQQQQLSPRADALPAETRIGFIGGGQMGSALMSGMLKSQLISGARLSVSDPSPSQFDYLQKQFSGQGVTVSQRNEDVISRSNVIVLAVKPHLAPKVLKEMANKGQGKNTLIVSICAGLSIESLEKCHDGVRVVRVMPNTPALVGHGASAYSLGESATNQDARLVSTMLEAVGEAYEVPESSLNAVTGVSGSGPAYIFLAIEALADGGVAAGLQRQLAQKLAVQTVLGAAQMMKASPEKSPGQFKDAVASPGGTTITAIRELEKRGLRAAFIEAVVAAANKGEQLQSKL